MNYAAKVTAMPDQLREFAEDDDYIREDGAAGTTVRASLMRAAAVSIETDTAELTALRERVAELERALQEADTIMGHDDSETEWREKWAGLWTGAVINKGKT